MTRRSVLEYVQAALRNRYFRALKEEKNKVLDEFTQVTGLHRKAATPQHQPIGEVVLSRAHPPLA